MDTSNQKQIADWEFSTVTPENAKIVWAYEVFRQCAAESTETIPRAQQKAWRELLRTSWTKIKWSDLEEWYGSKFGGGGYQFLVVQSDGSITPNNNLLPMFCDKGERLHASPGSELFGFYLSRYLPAKVAKAAVMGWFERYVLPRLVSPLPRRGRSFDRVAWLVDLAVYRAVRSGVPFGKLVARLSASIPRGGRYDARFKKGQMRQFVYGAKKRTEERLRDIGEKTFYYSEYGCRDGADKPVFNFH